MKHTLASSIFAAVFGLSVGSFSVGIASAQTAPVKLRFGHAHPVTDSQHVAALEFAKKVKERTQGGIEIQVFPSNQLGNDNTMIAGVRGGTIDIETSGNPFFTGIVPKLNVLDLPYLFDDATQVAKVLDGQIGRSLLNELEAHQMKGLAFWENGFRHLSNNKVAARTPEEAKGLKLRTMENKAHMLAFKTAGLSPAPMAWSEVYSALQVGVIDGQENPIAVFYSSKLFEIQKYLTLTGHVYSPALMIFSMKKWDRIPKADQEMIARTAQEVAVYERKLNRDEEDRKLKEIEQKGTTVVRDVDREAWVKAMEPAAAEFAKQFGQDKINAILETR